MKRSTPLFAALLMTGLAFTACGPGANPQFAVQTPVLKGRLANGLKLVVVPDKTTPMVQVDIRYEVGSNEDPEGKAGLAHLVEHMMFQHRFGKEGTPIESRPPTFQILPQLGVTNMNAYTYWDMTHYWLQARKEDLPNLIQLEAARLHTGCKLIPEEQFEREREVVRNEIRQRTGTPMGQMRYEALRAAYPEGHPYHEMIGGDDSQLTNITMDDVCEFMKDYYVPSRATMIVAGNVDYDEVGKLVDKFFSGIEKREPAPRLPVTPLKIEGRTVTQSFDLERTIVNVVWALPAHFTPEYENASFMQYALGNIAGTQAEKYNECDYLGTGEMGGILGPVMMVSLEVRPGHSPQDCLNYIWKAAAMTPRYFEDLDDFDSEERQKSLRKQSFVESMEPLSQRTEFVANSVQFDKRLNFDGEDNFFYKELERLETLSAGKFKSYVKKTLSKSKALVFIAKANSEGKKGDTRSKMTYSAGVAKLPDPVIDPATANVPLKVPSTDSILVQAERYELGNGLKVVLLPYEGLPLVQARLVLRTGNIHESDSKSGLADIAASLSVPRGAGKVFASGVNIGGSGGMETTTFYSTGINIYLDPIIQGMERVIKVGTLSQKAIEDYRKNLKARFKRPSFQRGHVFRLEMAEALYGKDHPYTTKGRATPKTLGNIGVDAAHSFGRKHYSAKNGTLIVVGNFDVEKVKRSIRGSFGEWGGGHRDAHISKANPQQTGRDNIRHIHKEFYQKNTNNI
jgi:predicted Zn-dependent peptidase